jgi:hypothetical protein
LSYLVFVRSHWKLDDDEPPITVSSIVSAWIDIILSKPHLGACPTLCFDSYYADNTSVLLCQEKGISMVCSVQVNRFTRLLERLEGGLQKRGDRVTLWNEETKTVLPLLIV